MFESMLTLQGTMFAIMVIGIFLRKKGILDRKAGSALTDLLIDVIVPCNIIMSFRISITLDVLKSSAAVLIAGIGTQFLALLLSKLVYRCDDHSHRVIMQYGTIVSNASFIGLVVLERVYGATGVLYGSIALIPMRIFIWSAGLSLFTTVNKKDMVKSVVFHPCVFAVFIGLLLSPFRLPEIFTGTLSYVGGCTTAISMIVIGGILAEVNPKTVLSVEVTWFSLVRLILMPLAVLLVMLPFRLDPVITGATVLIAGLPTGTTTAILAEKYQYDSEFAVKCVFMSTIFSMITVPVLCYLLTMLF